MDWQLQEIYLAMLEWNYYPKMGNLINTNDGATYLLLMLDPKDKGESKVRIVKSKK